MVRVFYSIKKSFYLNASHFCGTKTSVAHVHQPQHIKLDDMKSKNVAFLPLSSKSTYKNSNDFSHSRYTFFCRCCFFFHITLNVSGRLVHTAQCTFVDFYFRTTNFKISGIRCFDNDNRRVQFLILILSLSLHLFLIMSIKLCLN